MSVRRDSHNAVVLDDGRVLVVGGGPFTSSMSCEIFAPTTETWKITDSLLVDRKAGAQIVKLKNGNVLITGGVFYGGITPSIYLTDCEVFDVDSEKWIKVVDLNYNRSDYQITLLKDGKVLITGGVGKYPNFRETASCEIYDPALNEWCVVDSMNTARTSHSSVLLSDGKVLITGGTNYNTVEGPWLKSCEIYDPELDQWFYAGELKAPYSFHSTTQLTDSTFLIAGGSLDTWEIYNLNKKNSEYIDILSSYRFYPSVIKLESGNVLAMGGMIWDDWAVFVTAQCEIYEPTITSVERDEQFYLNDFVLFQNYPNPFNPTTTINFYLPISTNVKVKLYDSIGNELTTLFNGYKTKGFHSIMFNGGNYASGVYIYTIETARWKASRKITLLK